MTLSDATAAPMPSGQLLLSGLDQPSRFPSGILPRQRLRGLAESGVIRGVEGLDAVQFQPASLDLRLGDVAYQVRASFLAGENAGVLERAKELLVQQIDLQQPAMLQTGCIYVIPLLEELRLPDGVSGKTNPKSTVGRLDLFARVITDHGNYFEEVPPGYNGKLYLEVAPRSFHVVVRKGDRLAQLRLVLGTPPETGRRELGREELVYTEEGAPSSALIRDQGLWIHVDLKGSEAEVVGYKAVINAPPVDLARVDYYDPRDFWEPLVSPRGGQLILNPGDFYILSSRERMKVPPSYAAEMVGYEPSIGEFRVHYAGFFDPGFGLTAPTNAGTCAILEVRSHEVPFLMRDGQLVGKLTYGRLLEPPDVLYGPDLGSSYFNQGIKLSKQFKAYE